LFGLIQKDQEEKSTSNVKDLKMDSDVLLKDI